MTPLGKDLRAAKEDPERDYSVQCSDEPDKEPQPLIIVPESLNLTHEISVLGQWSGAITQLVYFLFDVRNASGAFFDRGDVFDEFEKDV
jgi:hypothetical protein